MLKSLKSLQRIPLSKPKGGTSWKQGDRVVTRESWAGTHGPSGKTFNGSLIHIFRLHDGKITDEWSMGWDWLEKLESGSE